MSALVRRSLLLSALLALLAFATTASAKTYEVTKKGDPSPGKCKRNDCSLREAVRAANKHQGKDVISLPSKSGAYKLALTATLEEDQAKNGDLDITDAVSVVHPGKGHATVDANRVDRAFDVQADAKSTFKKLVITGGKAFAAPEPPAPRSARASHRGMAASPEGGGIRNASTIKVISSVIKKNKSARYGGGIGVIDGAGLTLLHSTVTHNTSPGDGGGIDGDSGKTVIKNSKITNNEAAGNGGAMYYFSRKTSVIDKSTIAGNKATAAGGGLYVSANPTDKALKLTNSTVSGNRAGVDGGGILVSNGKLEATNSTIAGNRAGGMGGGIAETGGKTKLNSVTVVDNTADGAAILMQAVGGGLYYETPAPGFDVENSLIALNFSGTTRSDCAGTDDFDSKGHNLLSTNAGCGGFTKPGDIVKANPKIGKLKSNGGPTKTVALKKGSPAIGKAKKSSAPKRDQRGRKRDSKPDIGAFER